MEQNRKMVTAIIAATAAFSLIMGVYAIWTITVRAAPANAVKAYIYALAAGDTQVAMEASCGSAAWAANRTQVSPAEVTNMHTIVDEVGNGYAEARVYVELKLSDGSYDAGWYRLILCRDKEWQVIALQEYHWLSGVRRGVSGQDKKAMSEVFSTYLDLFKKGKHEEAAKHLCGSARRAHEQTEDSFRHLPVESIEKLEMNAVWQRGNQAVCRAEYQMDGRQVNVLVRFAKLADGWHIAAVDQL